MVAPISIEEKDLANQHLERSISLAMTGKYDQAIEEARKAVRIDADFFQAYNKLGDYYLKKRPGQRGNRRIPTGYHQANRKIRNSHFDLGRSLALIGDYENALTELNHAYQLKSSHTEILGHIGRVYLAIGSVEDAIAI